MAGEIQINSGGRNNCPNCSGRIELDSKRGERVCSECAQVVSEDEIDTGPEWRSFERTDTVQKSRVGAPETNMMHDKGRGASIGWRNKDANGNVLDSQQRNKAKRLRKWNQRFRVRNAQDRNLKQALSEIERMAAALGLPKDVRETASIIYRRALDEELLPGRSIEGVAAASLYLAARQANFPRSLSRMTAVSRVGHGRVASARRYLDKELDLKIEPADPKQYVGQIVENINTTTEASIKSEARTRLQNTSDEFISGKNPVGLAAAALYAVGKDELTQEAVADTADVCALTIRNHYEYFLK